MAKPVLRPIDPEEMEVDWRLHAKCRGMDPDTFFPERGEDDMPARRVCAVCPVKAPCLEYALVNNIKVGIYGGRSERERRRMRRERRTSLKETGELPAVQPLDTVPVRPKAGLCMCARCVAVRSFRTSSA